MTALRDGMRLAGLEEWFTAGCCDPRVAAAFRHAGWTTEQAFTRAADHMGARVVVGRARDMRPGDATIGPALAALLPQFANRGMSLDEAICAFLAGDHSG